MEENKYPSLLKECSLVTGGKEGKKGEAEQNLKSDAEDPLISKGSVASLLSEKFKTLGFVPKIYCGVAFGR